MFLIDRIVTIDAGPLLQIENLTVAYRQGKHWLDAVRDVSLTVTQGETLGLVGESGSGKTTLALAIMRYLGANGQVRSGRILYAGRDLLSLPESEMRRVWGSELSLVPQDPLSALNPTIRIDEQIAEVLRLHGGCTREQARARAIELLGNVHVSDPARVAASYPHQLSGGMQQRVMIALALSTEPKLLVLDEPTTNLDVTTQSTVLDLIGELIRARHTAALYVTHNLGVVARICDRVAVLYAGELLEEGSKYDLFHGPLHPYTQSLLDCVPRPGQTKATARLHAIDGQISPLGERPPACVFAPRCPLAIDRCHAERPAVDTAGENHRVRCHRWPEIAAGTVSARRAPEAANGGIAAQGDTVPLLSVEHLAMDYPLRRTLGELLRGRAPRTVRAVDDVSLVVGHAQTLGLVGESGSGKTTLARAIMGLVEATGGTVELQGVRLPPNLVARRRDLLRRLQIVFQNPEEALNPYLTVGEALRRPLERLLGQPRRAARARAGELLAAVRLPPSYASRVPSQLSGGEKQRVAIARAFASDPELLIGDEPVSALDVSVQASILNLLADLQVERGNSLLFISHDLAVVGYLADVVAVIYAGRLMEVTTAGELFAPPHHPYTATLLAAIPVPDPDATQEGASLSGVDALPHGQLAGCPFYARCPRVAGNICATETPPWRTGAGGKRIFCHIPLEELSQQQVRLHGPDGEEMR